MRILWNVEFIAQTACVISFVIKWHISVYHFNLICLLLPIFPPVFRALLAELFEEGNYFWHVETSLQCETFLDEHYLSVFHYTDFVMCVCVCSYWCHSYWREECFHFLTCWGTNDWFKKDRGISRTSKGCRVIFCSYPECSVISHREHYGHGLLCKGTAQRSGMQGMASVGLDSPLVTTGMNNMTPWQTDRHRFLTSFYLFILPSDCC